MNEIQNFNYMPIALIPPIECKQNQDDSRLFASQNVIKQNMELIDAIENLEIKCILEPSCGSCGFISTLNQKYSGVNITGVEKDPKIYSKIIELPLDHNGNQIHLINNDFISLNMIKKYDLIIGAPPHFIMKKTDIDKKYYKYFNDIPNMFMLFIVKSLEMLNNNGVLSFILPSSFLKCDYYDKLRKLINKNYKIINIADCGYDDLLETNKKNVLFIIQNIKETSCNDEFVEETNGFTIFNARET